MHGFIIAAVPGARMGFFTGSRPKCLLPGAGRTLLENVISNFRRVGCTEITVIVGHKAEMIRFPNVNYVLNSAYRDNNILHSLMKARDHLVGPVIVSYGDIWIEPWVLDKLLDTVGDIALAVDRDWLPYYEGRTKHPVSEAENVFFDDSGLVVNIGKHLEPRLAAHLTCGEFTGLWRMTEVGTFWFTREFSRLDDGLSPNARFQQAAQWRRAYITDIVQQLVDQGWPVNCAVIERGWAELDTEEDVQRLNVIAERQRLQTIVETGRLQ